MPPKIKRPDGPAKSHWLKCQGRPPPPAPKDWRQIESFRKAVHTGEVKRLQSISNLQAKIQEIRLSHPAVADATCSQVYEVPSVKVGKRCMYNQYTCTRCGKVKTIGGALQFPCSARGPGVTLEQFLSATRGPDAARRFKESARASRARNYISGDVAEKTRLRLLRKRAALREAKAAAASQAAGPNAAS